MNYPKITVITPSYNQGKFLEETILSVLEQNYPSLEYFIVDGGSTDNSKEIIKKYSDRISWWVSEPDSGQSEAINKGLLRASGEIITWISSDDLLKQNSLFQVAEEFRKSSPSVGVIHGAAEIFGSEFERLDWGYTDQGRERYLSGMAFPQPAAFIRKKYWDIVGPLNTSLHYGMDYDLFSRLALVCDFQAAKLVLARYRVHAESKSRSMNSRFIEDWLKVFTNILLNFKQDGLIEKMLQLGILNEIPAISQFKFKPNDVSINWSICYFNFLTYLLRSDYLNHNFKRAALVNNYLRRNYRAELSSSGELKKISTRLRLMHPALISSLRALKKRNR